MLTLLFPCGSEQFYYLHPQIALTCFPKYYYCFSFFATLSCFEFDTQNSPCWLWNFGTWKSTCIKIAKGATLLDNNANFIHSFSFSFIPEKSAWFQGKCPITVYLMTIFTGKTHRILFIYISIAGHLALKSFWAAYNILKYYIIK